MRRTRVDGGAGAVRSRNTYGMDVSRVGGRRARQKVGVALRGALRGAGQPIDMPSWVDDIAFLEDGTIVAAGSEALFVLDAQGQLQNTLEDLGYGARFFSSMIAGPGRVVFVSDANANKVVAVDLDRGVVGSAEIRSPGALHPNHDRSLIAVDTSSAVHVLDGQLQPKAQWKIPGKEGVRYVGQEPHSYTHWKSPSKPGYNSIDTGPKRDILGDLSTAVRAKEMRLGFYYCDCEWGNPVLSTAEGNGWVGGGRDPGKATVAAQPTICDPATPSASTTSGVTCSK